MMHRLLALALALPAARAAADCSAEFDKTKLATHASGERGKWWFQTHFTYEGEPVSPWHDVPFSAGGELVHFVCEIAVGTTAKFEIHKGLAKNPIKQDLKKDGETARARRGRRAPRRARAPSLAPPPSPRPRARPSRSRKNARAPSRPARPPQVREYAYGPSLCNYGAIAQTWEDPTVADDDTGLGGDNDPIDVLQLNERPCALGEVYAVRVLGALALIDDDETDHKLLVVDAADPLTAAWRDVSDVPKERVDALREWFRLYKTAEGKGENKFGFGEQAVGGAKARAIAAHTHARWRALVHDRSVQCEFGGAPCWLDHEPRCWAPPSAGAGGEL